MRIDAMSIEVRHRCLMPRGVSQSVVEVLEGSFGKQVMDPSRRLAAEDLICPKDALGLVGSEIERLWPWKLSSGPCLASSIAGRSVVLILRVSLGDGGFEETRKESRVDKFRETLRDSMALA
ncbi:hypothetical protein AAE478_008086 [Parahypoxylon ruwenzoriense]